jgi:cAMP-dependent protein kinase regulator
MTHEQRAAELAAAGKLQDAVEQYTAVLAVAPANVTARQRLAELLLKLGRKAHAVEQYLCLVGKYASEGQLLKAVATCHIVLQIDPGHSGTHAILADLYAQRDASRAAPPAESAGNGDRDGGAAQPPPDPAALARVPLFSEVPPEAFVPLIGVLSRREVPMGDVIVHEGAAGDTLYAVVEGLVRVERRNARGDVRVVAELGEGEFFGEISLLSGCPRLATVTAARDCELLELQRGGLERVAVAYPGIMDVVTRFYRERLLANVLRASPVLQKVPPDRRAALAEMFRIESYGPGELLLEEGKQGSEFFLLLRGECEVFHREQSGAARHLVPMREGDVFGEIALLQGGTITANVRTKTACVVLGLSRQSFEELLLVNATVREALFKLASRRLERTSDIVTKDLLDRGLV